MTIRRAEEIAPQLRALFVLGSPSSLTDGQLLDRFASGDAEASALAFEAIVERHGSMVLRVALGVLRDPHDAQDAFQATFLVLVRKARSIRDRDSLASWLHGVALRVANHARADQARRQRHERIKAEGSGSTVTVPPLDDLEATIHREVGRLPDRYRAAVVLCYLEGRTCEEAANVLRWPVGTVKSRLARARERLRRRLPHPGLTSATIARLLTPVSPRLVKETARISLQFGAKSTVPTSASGAVALATGVLNMMTVAALKWPAFALLAASSWLGVSSALSTAEPGLPIPKKPDPPIAIVQQHELGQFPESPLVAPRDLTVTAGKGTALMYALDDKGERIIERPKQDPEEAGLQPRPDAAFKETNKELRWVAVTGVLDHWLILERGKRAQGVDSPAFEPKYIRLEVQRQVGNPDGKWSDWKWLDKERNYTILDNLPELAKERTPERVRPPALVDPLPFLKKGTWNGVDPEILLKLSVGGTSPGAPDASNTTKGVGPSRTTTPPMLMVRFLDFTVEPGKTYRYCVGVAVDNPKASQKDAKKYLYSPWSEPTKEVVAP